MAQCIAGVKYYRLPILINMDEFYIEMNFA